MAATGGGMALQAGATKQNKRTGQFESGGTLTDKQTAYVAEYLRNGGQQGKAAEVAGYSSPDQAASHLMTLPQVKTAISTRMIDRINGAGGMKSVNWMISTLDDKTAPHNVQFQCAKWLAEAAGYGLAPKKAKEQADDGQFVKSPRDMTVAELERLVETAQRRYDQMKAEDAAIDAEAHNNAHNNIGLDDESE